MKEFFYQILTFLSNIPSFVWIILGVIFVIAFIIHVIVILKIKWLVNKARNSELYGFAKRNVSKGIGKVKSVMTTDTCSGEPYNQLPNIEDNQ